MECHKSSSLQEKMKQHKQGLSLSVQDHYFVSQALTEALLSSEHSENAFGMNGYKTRSSQRVSLPSEQMPDEDSSDLAYVVMNCATGVYY